MGSSMQQKDSLEYKIEQRLARVGIIGIGYVGMPTMVAVADGGFGVTGIDVNEVRVNQINLGKSYISDVPGDVLSGLVREGKILATVDFSVVRDLDIIIVCVPTPITEHKEPDLTAMNAAIGNVAAGGDIDIFEPQPVFKPHADMPRLAIGLPVEPVILVKRHLAEDRHAMMHPLPVEHDMRIAQRLERSAGEGAVDDLRFLKAQNIGLLLAQEALDNLDTEADGIDIPRNNAEALGHAHAM